MTVKCLLDGSVIKFAMVPSSAVRCSIPPKKHQFPVAFVDIAKEIEDGQPVLKSLQEVPDFVEKNTIWSALRDHVKLVRVICWGNSIAVFRLLLDDKTELVIKGCPPEALERNREQLAAEVAIATSFPLHPLMATLIAASEEPSGICLVLPYAGVSFAQMMQHPDYNKLTEEDRTQAFRLMAAHTMTVHAKLQGKGACGILYWDTKPDNVTFDPATGQVKLIDFGYAMDMYDSDYLEGFTIGRFTPEMVDPANGFSNFWTPTGRFLVLNRTTDVFLTGQQGLEMIHGLPQQLQACAFDMSDHQAMNAILLAHHNANYPKQIRRLRCSTARKFLLRAMAVDPNKRLKPAAALQHRFLAAPAAAVEARVADTLPAHAEQVCHILDLLAPLQRQPDVFLAVQQQQQGREQQATVAAALGAAPRWHGCDITGTSNCSSSNGNVSNQSLGAAFLERTSSSINNSSSCGRSDLSSTASISVEADIITAADAVQHKQRCFICGLWRKLKLRNSGSKSTRSNSSTSSTSNTPVTAPTIVDVLSSGAAVAVAFIGPAAVSVPGWCGIRWFARKSSSRSSSKKSLQ